MTRLALSLPLLLSVLAAAPARADVLLGPRRPELRWRGLELRPHARLSEAYHSNIYLTPVSTSTFIHQLDAGLKTRMTFAQAHRLDLGYALTYQAFTTNPSFNNALNQAADILYTYSGPRATFRARDAYVNTVDAPNNEQTQRRRRWRNDAGLEAEYGPEGGRLFVGAEAEQTTHKYVFDDPVVRAQLNRYEQGIAAKAGYRVLPRTRAYAGYRRGIVHYTAITTSPTKNHKSHTAVAGLEGDLGAKASGRLETGYQVRDYDDAPFPGAGTRAHNTVLHARVAYRPTERTRIDFSASRVIEEATFQQSRYYVATSGSVRLEHALPSGLTLSTHGIAERDRFSDVATIGGVTARREDEVYESAAGVEWRGQGWLAVGMRYAHRARFSTFPAQFAYRAHVGALFLELSF